MDSHVDSLSALQVLVGNKSDLDGNRAVSTAQGAALAAQWGCPFLETSAKRGVGVGSAFADAARAALRLGTAKGNEVKGTLCLLDA